MEHAFHVVVLLLFFNFHYKSHLQRSSSRILRFYLNRLVILLTRCQPFNIWNHHFSWSYNPNITIYFSQLWKSITDFEFDPQSYPRMLGTVTPIRTILLAFLSLLVIRDVLSCKASPFLSESNQQAIFKNCLTNSDTVMRRSTKNIKLGLRNHNHLFLRPVRPVPYSKVIHCINHCNLKWYLKIQFIS